MPTALRVTLPITLVALLASCGEPDSPPAAQPSETRGGVHLHGVSQELLGGGRPLSAADYTALADRGVRTLLCVEARPPDTAAAAAHGMRCIHVPLSFGAMRASTALTLAHVARQGSRPLYAYDGERGSRAGAALLWILRCDGRTAPEALAQVTALQGPNQDKLLWKSARLVALPAAEEIKALRGTPLPERVEPSGLLAAMQGVGAALEGLEAARIVGLTPSDSAGAAALVRALEGVASADPERARDERYRRVLDDATLAARYLELVVRKSDATKSPAAFGRVRAACDRCHSDFR